MGCNLLPENRKYLESDGVPSVKVKCSRSIVICVKVITSHETRKPLCTRAPGGNLTPGHINGTKST